MPLEKAVDIKKGFKKKKIKKDTVFFAKNIKDRLVCLSCGITVEVNYPFSTIDQEEIKKSLGFYPQFHRIVLYGYCKDCTYNLN